jgi:hypothetical protein
MYLRSVLAAAVLLSAGLAARADTTTTFTFVDNTYADGATGTGTVTIDTTTGVIGAIDFTFVDGAQEFTFSGSPTQGTSAFTPVDQFTAYNFGGDILVLDIFASTLVGYNGGALCDSNGLCGGDGFVQLSGDPLDALSTGSLVATPEPSSFLLLGIGLFGAVGMMRRWYA